MTLTMTRTPTQAEMLARAEYAERMARMARLINPDLHVMIWPRPQKRGIGLGIMSTARQLHPLCPIVRTYGRGVRPGHKRRSPKPGTRHGMTGTRTRIPGPWEYERKQRAQGLAQLKRVHAILMRGPDHGRVHRKWHDRYVQARRNFLGDFPDAIGEILQFEQAHRRSFRHA